MFHASQNSNILDSPFLNCFDGSQSWTACYICFLFLFYLLKLLPVPDCSSWYVGGLWYKLGWKDGLKALCMF